MFPFPKKEWSKQDWQRLKNLTKEDLISLLKKDPRWEFAGTEGARFVFLNRRLQEPYTHLTIHYHKKEGFRDKGLLKNILDHWCCTREDLKKWKVLK